VKFIQSLFVNGLRVGVLFALLSSVVGAKPLAPIQVSIEPAHAPVRGQPVEFVVRATVNMDMDSLQIAVSVPPSVTITSGESQWHGQLLKGEEKQLRFTAVATGNAVQIIKARAFIVVGGKAPNGSQGSLSQDGNVSQFSASATYVWALDAARAASTQLAPQSLSPLNSLENPRIVQRNGRKIAEYPLRP
jgi:hypothetical protein